MYLDNIFIRPNTNSATIFSRNFDGGNTNGWSDTSGKWYPTNDTYNCRGYNGQPLTFAVQSALQTIPRTYPVSGWDVTWLTVSNCLNTHYEYVTNLVIQQADPRLIRVRQTSGPGSGSLVLDGFNLTSWHGVDASDSSGWLATESWTTTASAMRTNSLLLLRSHAYSNANQYLLSPPLTNGVGVISFYNRSFDGNPVTFEIRVAQDTNLLYDSSALVLTATNSSTDWLSPSNYVNCQVDLMPPPVGAYYVMILHTTTNLTRGLMLDQVQISDYTTRDAFTWVGYNALVTASQTNRLRRTTSNLKGAYLNNHPTNDTAPGALAFTNGSYIQSCLLTNGVGEISFWYRNWGNDQPNPITNPCSFVIKAAASNGAPPSEWSPLAGNAMTNIVNTAFKYFTITNYDSSSRFVRVYCDTNTTAGRLCLDDLLITAPYGADLKMRNLTTIPQIPLNSDTNVRFTVELYEPFLVSRITNVTAYYYVGTNPWATWSSGTAIPMVQTGTNGSARIYTTAYPVQPAPLSEDVVVQYFVQCGFTGPFSDKSSPKTHRDFTNPSWYHPTDLNFGKPSKNPYYIVFSCPPGAVWINEFRYQNVFNITNEYVELCGPWDTVIKNWRIELVDPGAGGPTVYDSCLITNPPMIPHDSTNGFGYFVFGGPDVTNVDQVFTNPVGYNIHNNAGIRLIRSMGAYEYQICYGPSPGTLPSDGFEWITNSSGMHPNESTGGKRSLFLTGTAGSYSNFVWSSGSSSGSWTTPGMVNSNQTLQGEGSAVNIVINITDFWMAGNSNWITFTVTGTTCIIDTPVPWYSTNLLNSNWYAVTNSHFTWYYENSTGFYTEWFPPLTNNSVYFYRVLTNQ